MNSLKKAQIPDKYSSVLNGLNRDPSLERPLVSPATSASRTLKGAPSGSSTSTGWFSAGLSLHSIKRDFPKLPIVSRSIKGRNSAATLQNRLDMAQSVSKTKDDEIDTFLQISKHITFLSTQSNLNQTSYNFSKSKSNPQIADISKPLHKDKSMLKQNVTTERFLLSTEKFNSFNFDRRNSSNDVSELKAYEQMVPRTAFKVTDDYLYPLQSEMLGEHAENQKVLERENYIDNLDGAMQTMKSFHALKDRLVGGLTDPKRRFVMKKPIDYRNLSRIKIKEEEQILSHKVTKVYRKIQRKFLDVKLDTKKSINFVKKTLLVIENYLLDDARTSSSLKFCYIDIPVYQELVKEEEIFKDYQKLVQNLAQKMCMGAKDIYLFLKNGFQIGGMLDIPSDQFTLILSTKPLFQGILRASRTKSHLISLMKIIRELEYPVLKKNEVFLSNKVSKESQTLEEKIREEYKVVIEDIITLFEKGRFMSSTELEELNEKLKDQTNLSKISLILEEEPERYLKERAQPRESSLSIKQGRAKVKRLNFDNLDDYMNESQTERTLVKSKRYDEVNEMCDFYESKMTQKVKFRPEGYFEDENLDRVGGTKNLKNEITGKDLEKIANNLDIMLEKWNSFHKRKKYAHYFEREEEKIADSHKSHEDYVPLLASVMQNMKPKQDFLKKNKNNLLTKKRVLQVLTQKNREIFLQNIPKLCRKTNFTRRELHSIYILYKALHEISSQRTLEYDLDDGLDYGTFRNGIYQVFVQSEQLAKRIFNTIDTNDSGYLNWEEFLSLMEIIRAKTLKEKIDLFIKIADEDGNGNLSMDEIFNLCRFNLSKYIKVDEFLDGMSEYFARLIFAAVNVELDKEIPLTIIKQAILMGNEESDLLCMFCGADI